MRQAFVQAALRGIRAGYVGVEVHACHGFLLGQFLSPLTNFRRDAYGGEIAGRSRLLRDIVAALREELGDALLSVRLGVADELGEKPRGLAFEDVLWAGKELAALGVDMISVSGNFCGFDAPRTAPWAPYAAAIQQRVGDVPVLCTGNIRSLEEAESLLERGCCTLIGLGRPFVQNPNILSEWGYAPCKGCSLCGEGKHPE
jgi:2,4-dienoyl-CoA reductase-like NADH-dependent reductase (Old Yellow Enzyme family)